MSDAAPKKKMTTLLLAVLPGSFGLFGIHRFYTGHTVPGVIQLLTFGGCGIWQLIDVIQIITGKFTDSSGNTLEA